MNVIELSARKLSEFSEHNNNNKELVDEFSARESSETDKKPRKLSFLENNSLRASNYIVHDKTDNCEMSTEEYCDECCCDVNDDDSEKRRLISTGNLSSGDEQHQYESTEHQENDLLLQN